MLKTIETPVQLMSKLDVSYVALPTHVVKRDGRDVAFDAFRIRRAMDRCFQAIGQTPSENLDVLLMRVLNILSAQPAPHSVEKTQDAVELVLLGSGEFEAAKAYILYRAEHARLRGRVVPAEVKAIFDEADQYFPTPLQKFQFLDKYSRFDNSKGRRETWPETVNRAVNFLYELAGDRVSSSDYERIRQAILHMQAMPSMRLLAMAGEAARRDNLTTFNCSYLPVDSFDSFSEALLISMAGCGVGFSVEERYVDNLPRVIRQRNLKPDILLVDDTSEGWANALKTGLRTWFDGGDVRFDLSTIRPAGTPLRVKGGRASGPLPLQTLLEFARKRILARQGKHLRPIDAHDLLCAVGTAIGSGGVRRTAMLSLYDFDDIEMRDCKSGDFERDASVRWMANNSAVWPHEGVNQQQVVDQMLAMVKTQRGEPGIFNRKAVYDSQPSWRKDLGYYESGTNPCGEVSLRPFELCNLSISVARSYDTVETLKEKVSIAALIGTIQSLATYFPTLRPIWKENCEEERLLGVDITGQMDCPIVQDAAVMQRLRDIAIQTNVHYAHQLGINRSASVTCIKPSGNSSQLLNCSSGLHTRYAQYYERNVRVSATSPLFKVLQEAEVPMDPENGQLPDTANTWVIHFPVKAPDNAITRHDRTALQQCDYWLLNKVNYTTHNPSVTISYRPDEIIDLTKWVWEHRDLIGGMAFLPTFDAQYAQLPYIELTKEEYENRVAVFPKIEFSRVFAYEMSDTTTSSQELACSSGTCSVDDIPSV